VDARDIPGAAGEGLSFGAPSPQGLLSGLNAQDALDDCANRLDFLQAALCWAAYGQSIQLSDTAVAGLTAILTDITQALRRDCGA
jgi:hypothetical protein